MLFELHGRCLCFPLSTLEQIILESERRAVFSSSAPPASPNAAAPPTDIHSFHPAQQLQLPPPANTPTSVPPPPRPFSASWALPPPPRPPSPPRTRRLPPPPHRPRAPRHPAPLAPLGNPHPHHPRRPIPRHSARRESQSAWERWGGEGGRRTSWIRNARPGPSSSSYSLPSSSESVSASGSVTTPGMAGFALEVEGGLAIPVVSSTLGEVCVCSACSAIARRWIRERR